MVDRWDREYRDQDLNYERNRGYGRSDTDYDRDRSWFNREGRWFERERDYGRDRPYDRSRGYGRQEDRGWLSRAVDRVKDVFTSEEEHDRQRRQDRDYGGGYGRDHGTNEREGRYGAGSSYGGGMFGVAGYGPGYGVGRGLGTGAGRYAGRGPKGYRRSDQRIMEDVCEILTRHPDVDASDIDIRVENAVVTLSGTVDHRHGKRVAEDAAYVVRGVADVRNEIRVVAGAGHLGSERSGTGQSL
jgi:hypothetical protein